jgi:hypothetical protein
MFSLALLLCLAPIGSALAQGQPPSKPIDAAGRHAVIASLGKQLQANYVFPEVAKTLTASLAAKEAAGGYDAAANTSSFGDALSKDLREMAGRHPARLRPASARRRRPRHRAAGMATGSRRSRFRIQKVEILQGNVGLEVRGFGPTEFVSEAFDAP